MGNSSNLLLKNFWFKELLENFCFVSELSELNKAFEAVFWEKFFEEEPLEFVVGLVPDFDISYSLSDLLALENESWIFIHKFGEFFSVITSKSMLDLSPNIILFFIFN